MGSNKILVVGDLHGHWAMLNELIYKEEPDIILQCGDFEFFPGVYDKKRIKSKNTAIYWCDGNHEHHWRLIKLAKKNKFGPIKVGPNVFYMPRGATLTLPDRKKVMFFGGANSIDKKARILGVSWFPEEVISNKNFKNLPDTNIDIMITHTCPSNFFAELNEKGVPDKMGWEEIHKDPSRKALSILLDIYKPPLWFFGHFHTFVKGVYKHVGGEETTWTALDMAGSKNWYITL
jgi:Icc-related predicted phosphoesterase